MKQKRKVKSLLSLKKSKKELFLMNLLLILSVSLCIGSALLITTSVGATADDTNICPNDICSYTGLDDKSEVLYRMDFVDPENLEKTVNSMYIKNSNFYITSGQVIVNPATADETDIDRNVNKVGTGVYSHILGGSGNEVYSDNITIIAGENNKISSGNDNATILGGKNNNLSGGTPQGTPIISLGGENNKVGDGNDGVALIGGEGNEIGEAVSNTFILGGKNNKVSDTENVIVGGSDVTISGTKNIFVYSNSGNFEPKTDNAFYLNVIGGVGINGTGSVGGMAAENAVSIGDIDINNPCNEDNLGVVGSYQGCLVGCTQKGKEENKWELLDRGSGCIDICSKNDKCIAGNNITGDVIPTTNYDAQCTTGYVDITNAELCPYMNTGLYKNVIFETNLVDSDDPCPFEQENQCVYKCKTGFHLTGDVVSNTIKCYKDCELPWTDANGNKIEIKHNDTVTAYNTENVSCSNAIYIFPFSTELNNKGTPVANPMYTLWNTSINGVAYNKRAKNGKSYESCGNYDHKKTLICNNGVLEMMNKDGKPIANTSELAQTYKYASCNLYSYSCDTSVYNLTQQQIQNEKMDQPKDGNRSIADRGALQGIRGIYTGCIDYSVSPNPTPKGESCAKGEYHYKFIKCQNGYDLMDGKCMKRCYLQGNKCDVNKDGVFNISDNTRYGTNCKNNPSSPIECDLNGDGKYDNADSVLFQSCSASVALSGVYAHGTVTTGYKAASATCTGTCQAIGLRCNDGDWVSTTNGNKVTDYPYNNCTLHPKTCGDQYNVSHADYLQWSGTSIYESCESYNPNGKFQCDYSDTTYHLIDCKEGYHTDNGKWCISNKQPINCNEIGKYKPEEHSAWIASTCEILKDNNEICEILKVWKGTRKTGDYTTYEPDPYCEWDCVGSYHKNSDKTKCISNSCGGTPPQGTGVIKGSTTPNNDGKTWEYITGASQTGLLACQWSCKGGYHKEGTGCELNICTNKPANAVLITGTDKNLTGNMPSTLYSNLLAANGKKCAYLCDESDYYFYFPTNGGECERVTSECDNNQLYGCTNPLANPTHQSGDDSKDTWDCEYNSKSLAEGCFKCKTGYTQQGDTCVMEGCQVDDEYGQPALPARDSTKYLWNDMLSTDMDEDEYRWNYATPDQWSAYGYRSSCMWTCADGYVINSDYTECVLNNRPICNIGNKSNIRSKQKFCNVGTESGVELRWEYAGHEAYPYWQYYCISDGRQPEPCSKYPEFVLVFAPRVNGACNSHDGQCYLTDNIQTFGVDSSRLSDILSGVQYLFNSKGDCVYMPGKSKPRGAVNSSSHNLQKFFGNNYSFINMYSSFGSDLEVCGRNTSNLPSGWTKSELDYLVMPDSDGGDIGVIISRES